MWGRRLFLRERSPWIGRGFPSGDRRSRLGAIWQSAKAHARSNTHRRGIWIEYFRLRKSGCGLLCPAGISRLKCIPATSAWPLGRRMGAGRASRTCRTRCWFCCDDTVCRNVAEGSPAARWEVICKAWQKEFAGFTSDLRDQSPGKG